MKLLISLFILGNILLAKIDLPQTFTTDFHQTITNEKGKVITYDGKVVFQSLEELATKDNKAFYAPTLFKWSYTSPTKKEVCTDGAELIVVDHDLEQVSTYMVDDGINLKEILQVAKKISTGEYKATYKEVEYLVSLDKKEQLEQIVYVDNLDNAVKIIFKNMNYNSTVDTNSLDCNAPNSYDIIKG